MNDNDSSQLVHCVSVLVPVSADVAYRYLTDGRELGRWALGAFGTEASGQPEVFRGVSLFDDQPCFVKPVGDLAARRIVYHVGADAMHLVPRIQAQVVDGEALGHPATCCQVTLLAWRHQSMSEARWVQLQRCHELEVLLIRARLERWQTA